MGYFDNMITLVIHTIERAEKLKNVLETHGIVVSLEDIDVKDAGLIGAPKAVRVFKKDLSLALKILESGDLVSSPLSAAKLSNLGKNILIPVDFSPGSFVAVQAGFFLAQKFNIEPVILHSYLSPIFDSADPYADSYDDPSSLDVDLSDLRAVASKQLSSFKRKIEKQQAEGIIPNVKFSTTLLEGIPEQVISEFCRQNSPAITVMATRDKSKKETDLVGSVTAEVIDNSRVPIFSLPSNYPLSEIDNIRRVLLFCNFSKFDIITVRALMRMFDFPACEVYLAPEYNSGRADASSRLDELRTYLNSAYPTAKFHTFYTDKKNFNSDMNALLNKKNIQIIITPNRKSSALSRLFHPSLAHRILFERDIPLLALPV